MIKNFESLADRLTGIKLNGEEITPEKFLEAMKSDEEHEIEVSQALIMNDEKLTELKETVKKQGYEEGKTAGSEMTIKDLKKKFGIEAEGKSVDSFYKHATEKILTDAGKETEPKIKELQTSLEKLQNQYQTDISERETQIGSLKNKIKDTQTTGMLMQSMPQLNGVKPNQAATLFKMEYELDYDENNNPIVKKNGAVLKNKMEQPIPYNEVLTDFLTQNNWLAQQGGRGGGSTTTTGGGSSQFKTINDVFRHMEKNKIDITSSEGEKLIKEFEASQE